MAFSRPRIALAALDGFEEPQAIRLVLESWGQDVEWLPIGRPSELLELLAGQASAAPTVVISGHGDRRGLLVQRLDPGVASGEPFIDALTPELAQGKVALPDRLVLSTACDTAQLAPALAAGGCRAYVAPTGYPEASDALAFALVFLFRALVLEEEPGQAHAAAAIAAPAAGFELSASRGVGNPASLSRKSGR